MDLQSCGYPLSRIGRGRGEVIGVADLGRARVMWTSRWSSYWVGEDAEECSSAVDSVALKIHVDLDLTVMLVAAALKFGQRSWMKLLASQQLDGVRHAEAEALS